MFKKIISGLLVLFILGNVIFIIFRIQSMKPEDNFFNKNLREKIAKNIFLRKVFGLHFDGDAASDYLSRKYPKILIEVDTMKGLDFKQEALDVLAEKISSVTGKKVEYIISDQIIPYQENTAQSDINQTKKIYRNFFTKNDEAVIYLLGLSRNEEKPTTMGVTTYGDGVVIFLDEITEFTAKNPSALAYYQQSTALHEFGHQIRLAHNEEFGCLMGEFVEQSHVARQTSENIITDFCGYEKLEIEKIAKEYN